MFVSPSLKTDHYILLVDFKVKSYVNFELAGSTTDI